MRILFLSVVAALGLMLGMCQPTGTREGRGGGRTAQKTMVALIFCDVTNSLTEGENQRVSGLAANIVDALPEGAIYKLYPVQIQTQVLAQIKIDLNENDLEDKEDYTVPAPADDVEAKQNEALWQQQRKKRREQIHKRVDELYDLHNKGQDNRTCLLNAVGFASNYINTDFGDAERFDVRVFFISDMIEECNNTPLPGGAVEMDKGDISREIERASSLQDANAQPDHASPPNPKFKCNLTASTFYCVFPTAADTPQVSNRRRPNRDDVKRFWGEILKSCGLKDDQPGRGRVIWVDSGDMTEQLKKLLLPG